MKKFSLIILVLVYSSTFSQEINKKKIDEKSQTEILIGLCNREGLKSNIFNSYFDPEYKAYIPDEATITKLKGLLNNKKITVKIVMGMWCGDSQELVPRFYKIIDALNFSDDNITLYCVDRTKKTEKGETENLKIQLVPVFIFYLNGTEVGRITEIPEVSLEKDMLEIVENSK
ncbi:MAG: thioredoxin family protein [Bacteroidetes bacterium]|nr:thioredoxin family protein [Bacteroidota bacterium]